MLHGESVVPSTSRIVAGSSFPRLLVYEFRQDDPKKCTSARLRKSRLVQGLPNMRQIPSSAVVLNPTSSKTLSIEDRELILRNGLVALDCFWKKNFSVRAKGKCLNRLFVP